MQAYKGNNALRLDFVRKHMKRVKHCFRLRKKCFRLKTDILLQYPILIPEKCQIKPFSVIIRRKTSYGRSIPVEALLRASFWEQWMTITTSILITDILIQKANQNPVSVILSRVLKTESSGFMKSGNGPVVVKEHIPTAPILMIKHEKLVTSAVKKPATI